MEEELYLCFAKQGQLYFTSQNAENVLCDEWDKRFDECNPDFIKTENNSCVKVIKVHREYDYLFDKYNTIDCLSIDEVTLRGLGMSDGYLIGSCTAYELNNQQVNDFFAIPWACIVENGCNIVEKLFSNMTYEKVLNLFRFYEVKYQTYSL